VAAALGLVSNLISQFEWDKKVTLDPQTPTGYPRTIERTFAAYA
jgi:hypothetical protein